jgi:hypothetical protein
MHQPVKVACALLDLLPHVVVDFHVEDVGHQIEGILVVLHFCVQSSQVEAICEVVLIDFAEVFIAACCYELRYCQHIVLSKKEKIRHLQTNRYGVLQKVAGPTEVLCSDIMKHLES